MEFTYFGKYAAGKVTIGVYLESKEQLAVSVLSDEHGSLVQAFKKLALKGGLLKKGADLSSLHSLLSAHSAIFEFVTTRPTTELVERLLPSRESATQWLERTLEKLDEEIAAVKDEYTRWRGVRDIDEAHENLANRREEIFDLNQKLIANAREPSFVYSPTKWVPSEWQRTDRVRFHELKDQAKEKVSSLRSRIDFTYRDRIKQLEEKRRELVREIDAERNKDAQVTERHAAILEDSLGTALLLTVRSRPVFTTRPVSDAVKATARDVLRETASLRAKIRERLGLDFKDADEVMLLAPILIPDARAPARFQGIARELAESVERSLGLSPRLATERETAKVVVQLLHRSEGQPRDVGELLRYPSPSDSSTRRLLYLGAALDSGSAPTERLVFYDIDVLTRHVAVSGGSGSGKSVAARLVVEGAALHGVPSVIFDPTRSWTGMATPCAGALLKRYDAFKMRTEWARAFELRVLDAELFTNVDAKELLAYQGLSVIPAWKLTQEQERAVIVNLLASVQKAVADWPESSQLRALLVFEEAHRYLQGGELEAMLELLARTARAKGLGLLFVSQNNVDLPPGVRNNAATRVQMQTAYGPDLTRAAQTFGSDLAKKIPSLKQGCGVIHYPDYGPALVAFRPPLCNPHAISEDVVGFYQVCRNLAEVTRQILTSQGLPDGTPWSPSVATGDTASRVGIESAKNDATEPSEGQTTRDSGTVATDWREVATRAAASTTAQEIAAEIRASGLEPPSLRSLQRFQRKQRGILRK